MRGVLNIIAIVSLSLVFICCHSTKKFKTAISRKDTTVISTVSNVMDSTKLLAEIKSNIYKNHIDFNTFSAKIKVQYEDGNGKQPDVNAFVRMYKDSVIWISINATFLNIEAFRMMITKDSIFIINKLDKVKSYHPLSYLEDVAHIPLDLHTLQELIIGNPIYVGGKIVSFKKTENRTLISTSGKLFKNLITLSSDNNLLIRSKLDDLDVLQNRTADISYGEYENIGTNSFPTYREITVAEKTKVDIVLFFKQYDFNKELSFPFNMPKNYKVK
jgi:hypothetical protein